MFLSMIDLKKLVPVTLIVFPALASAATFTGKACKLDETAAQEAAVLRLEAKIEEETEYAMHELTFVESKRTVLCGKRSGLASGCCVVTAVGKWE